jgi:hypothetical protein
MVLREGQKYCGWREIYKSELPNIMSHDRVTMDGVWIGNRMY